MKFPVLRNIRSLAAGAAFGAAVMMPPPATAASDPFVGELMVAGFNFCPQGWAAADGQLLPISGNTALFSLLGTTYGGDGRVTFGLPDLRGRAAIHRGQGPGLTDYSQGQQGGTESTTITITNMPPHNHQVRATNAFGDKGGPGDKYLASDSIPSGVFQYNAGPPNKTMASDMIANTGGGQPINNLSPYLTMMWCIAMQGIFPPRN